MVCFRRYLAFTSKNLQTLQTQEISKPMGRVFKPGLLVYEPLPSQTFIDAILLNILQHSSLTYGSCKSL